MVALGTTFSAYWILMNNSWMQVPVGYEEIDGRFVPADWARSRSARSPGSASCTC